MHDWTLISVAFDWKSARAIFLFRSTAGTEEVLIGDGVLELNLAHAAPWGPSVSVNEVVGPLDGEAGTKTLGIEMQSGDMIKLIARSVTMPGAGDSDKRDGEPHRV
jgi:hypothetical protein